MIFGGKVQFGIILYKFYVVGAIEVRGTKVGFGGVAVATRVVSRFRFTKVNLVRQRRNQGLKAKVAGKVAHYKSKSLTKICECGTASLLVGIPC